MPENVKGFMVSRRFFMGISLLSRQQKGALLEALFADMGEGAFPDLDPVTEAVFRMMLPTVHEAQESFARRSEANRENGKLGGRPKKEQGLGENPSFFEKSDASSENPKNPSVLEKPDKKRKEMSGNDPKVKKEENKKEETSARSRLPSSPAKGESDDPEQFFGEYQSVRLSEKEYERLCARYGKAETDEAIAFLDLHIRAKGKDPYKDHCAALQKWVYDAVAKQQAERKSAEARASHPWQKEWISNEERRQQHNNDVCRQVLEEFEAMGESALSAPLVRADENG